MSERERSTASGGGKEDPLEGTAYRTLARLTRGSMGEIVEAEHIGLRRRVIVKIPHDYYAHSPEFVDRFRLEAQSLAALAPRSPHIVAIQDVSVTKQGRPFLVLERLKGRSLHEEIAARRALPVEEAIAFTLELLDALGVAHEAGIVHRDVKPENIFLAEQERGPRRIVKLLDFGIVKVLPGASPDDTPAPILQPTEEGSVMGTPRYLAPEQARGEPSIDHRADIYAAGAVLYTMLTGRDPFAEAESLAAILRAHVLTEPAPPSRHAREPIPPWLDGVVLQALSKDRERRFQSAAAFASALQGSQQALPAPRTLKGTEFMLRRPVFDAAPRTSFAGLDRTEPLDTTAFRGLGTSSSTSTATPTDSIPETEATAPSQDAATVIRPRAGNPLALLAARRRRRWWVVALLVLLALAGLVALGAAIASRDAGANVTPLLQPGNPVSSRCGGEAACDGWRA